MRRALPVLLATLGAIALLAGFHTSPAHPSSVVAVAPSTTEPAVTDQRATPAGGTPPPSAAPTTTPRTTAVPAARRAFDGQAVYTQFGDVQVRVVLQGTRIIDVQSLQLPYSHQRSQYISDRAGPWLHDEALRAQSARIQTISGATYTSIAYRQSLQSALDRAASR